jgi:hypothetical protein
MTKSVLVNFSMDFNKISLAYSHGPFVDNISNTFNFLIGCPNGTLSSYGYTLTYPGNTSTNSGNFSSGSQLSSNITLIGSTVLDTVRLDYYYVTNISGRRDFTLLLPITIPNQETNNTLSANKDKTYGMGIMERLLVNTLFLLILVGIATLVGHILAGVALAAFIEGYLAKIGFLPLWVVLPMMFILFLYLIWKSGEF